MVLLAMIYTRSFYGIKALFRRLPGPKHIRPALGALLTGVVGVALYYAFGQQPKALAVMGFGYSAIQKTLTEAGSAGASLLLAIALGKILTTSLTIGSGGAGGVFGPSMVIGACGGAALGIWLHAIWPDVVHEPSCFAVVGMAGFFAAAAKTPFSTLIMVSEITGGYQLLLPALWVCTIAFMLSDRQSIYSSQVEGRARSGAHRGALVRVLLEGVLVRQLLDTRKSSPRPLRANASLAAVLARFDADSTGVLPVVDEHDALLGIVNLEEVYVASQSPDLKALVVAADLMRSDITPLTPNDTLQTAAERFAENDLGSLPIVDDLESRRFLGLLRRTDVASTYLKMLHGTSDADAARTSN
jgi:CIC family chloride channel protein